MTTAPVAPSTPELSLDDLALDVVHHDDWGAGPFVRKVTESGLAYRPVTLDSPTGGHVSIEGRDYTNFAGCSFLGMHDDAVSIESFSHGSRQYGLATGGSRLLQGRSRAHARLEEVTARMTRKPAAISFASGMLANMGFIQAMSGVTQVSTDLAWDRSDTVFVLDRDSHWSLWKAVEHLPFGKRVFAFRHNDVDHLDTVLAKLDGRPAVVVFESVYSADGSVAPVRRIVDLAKRHHAMTFVDDANGFMVYDQVESGFARDFDALAETTFHMVSYSKAVGLEGGALCASRDYVDIFEWFSGTSAFTASMLPPAAHAGADIIERIANDPGIVADYLAVAKKLRDRLTEAGFRLSTTPTYITNLFIGPDETVESVRQEAREAGFLVPSFRYPAVKRGQAGLRLTPSIRHTDEDITRFVDVLARLKTRYGF